MPLVQSQAVIGGRIPRGGCEWNGEPGGAPGKTLNEFRLYGATAYSPAPL